MALCYNFINNTSALYGESLKNLFYLDLRSLALFRVVLGIILTFDFLNRIWLVEPFYSDGGILSRSDFIANVEIPWKMTLLNLNGSSIYAYFLIFLGVVSSFFYSLGLKTRFFAVAAWILL